MYIEDIDNALILVGQNNTGKTAVLDAVRAVGGSYRIQPEDFQENNSNIEVFVSLEFLEEDLIRLQKNGVVSQYRRFGAWEADFRRKLPSFDDKGILTFEFVANKDGRIRYSDGVKKNNPYSGSISTDILYGHTERLKSASGGSADAAGGCASEKNAVGLLHF